MTLFERRSSMESFDRWRASSPAGSERRKLTFNPVSEWSPMAAEEEPIGAFEVSAAWRIAQVSIAVLYCLLASGVVFGFAAIKPVFISEGVYRDKCTAAELREGVYVCYEQELRLNLMFTVAAVSTNVCALPVGAVLDRFGPRAAGLAGAFFLATGSLLLAFAADVAPVFDAYITGYLLLALGGPFLFIPAFQLSNTFPRHSGLILALLTGAFDTSSAVFLAYRLIYQRSPSSLPPKLFFLSYLPIPFLILLAQVFIMPSASYKTVGELLTQAEDPLPDPLTPDSASALSTSSARLHALDLRRERHDQLLDEITSLLGSKTGDQHLRQESAKAARSGVWGALHGRPALRQIASPWFVLIALFTVVQMLRINYFVATVRTQYAQMLGSLALAERVNGVFDVALPLGGVVAVPFIGLVLDRTSTPLVLLLLVAMATAIGAFGAVPREWAAYVNVALFVLYRPLYYTAVSDYSAKVFGFATFGKVYGLIICLAGVFNFSQAGLDALTHRAFGDDPIPVNLILMGTTLVIGAALVGFVWRKSLTIEREMLQEEAEGARETLMPGADEDLVDRPHGHETYGTA